MKNESRPSWPILFLFFCSGATALIYEVIWSKYLAQMFGSTIYAQTVVLAVFMGGLAIGNKWFGLKADYLRNPVKVYGFVEGAIGLFAFFFTTLYAGVDHMFVKLGTPLLEHSFSLLLLKGFLSLVLLIVPTILMGGTLPLLAAFLQKTSLDAGRKSARFYSVNSLGAVFGSAAAGFYLVESWGMTGALQLTALVNLCIGAAAFLLSGGYETRASTGMEAAAEAKDNSARHNGALFAGMMVALTGAISMGLEVLSSRSMALLFGSSLQSFAIVLISFILGISLGSGFIASSRLTRWNSSKLCAMLLIAASLWIGLLVWNIESWIEVYRFLRSGLARSSMGYVFYELLAAGLSMVVLGIPAGMTGAVLPLLIRSFADKAGSLGAQVGRLLTWNTIGAVCGVLLTGFVLMPRLGLRNAFLILAAGLAAAGFLASLREKARVLASVTASVSLVLMASMFIGNSGWQHVMSSGVFRARETEVVKGVMASRKEHIKIHFYEDAADATVTIEQGDGIGAPNDLGLRLNGKADASTRADLCTQLMVGHIPMAACPNAKDVFILGLGSGITGGAILGHPIEHLTIAENCEPVIRAAKYFGPWNRGVLTNPVARIWCEDARTVLKLSPKKYDVIITQPSNPWMAGVGSVFSREYYELGASRLKEGGIMAQWFHSYDMHDGIVSLVLRTFGSVFPNMEIWDSASGDLILLGSAKSWRSDTTVYKALFERAGPLADFKRVGIDSPEALWARQLASQNTAFAIAGDGPVQSDLFPVLEYEAPRAFFIGSQARDLVKYDERTWQSELSPVEKQRTLSALPGERLNKVFLEYSTINTELRSHLLWRFHNGIGAAPEFRPWWPCIFKTNEFNLPAAQAGADAPEEVKALMAAAAAIERGGNQREAGIENISSLLKSYGPKSDWSVGHYAALAARASLGDSHPERAKEILEQAIRLRPEDQTLNYLNRIASRQTSALAAVQGQRFSKLDGLRTQGLTQAGAEPVP
ncbi:MAG TPA: fused MFS/spermidine synthase [Candidatus Saccharimonadales bacterium]|nr:fused MFS/spermidine synthase [Candidatus Saccharimonadales bacterium]